jgi:Dolichyl-phosphate-mannose-protein mannosyltransferase
VRNRPASSARKAARDSEFPAGTLSLVDSDQARKESGLSIGERLLDFALGLALGAVFLTLLGGRLELDVLGARMRVGGFERPLLLAMALALVRGLGKGGWLRRLPAALKSPALPTESEVRTAQRLKIELVFGALAVAASPLFLDDQSVFYGPDRWHPLMLSAVVLASYGWLADRGLFGAVDGRGRRLNRLDAVLLLALPLYGLLIGNGGLISSGDNMATRELGPLLLRHHTIELSSIPDFRKEPLHYSALRIGGRILPSFPLGTGILSVPYAAMALAASHGVVTESFLSRSEKHLAALIAVASTLLLFSGVRRRFGENVAIATSAVFAFGTTVFTCVGQSLFSTTGEVFFFCLALALLLPEDASLASVIGAGLAMGGAFLCRPSALLATGCMGLALLLRRRRDGVAFGAAAGAVIVVIGVWLRSLYGHPLGGYALMNTQTGIWGHSILEGLAGNLISPSRGVLFFFPYLFFLPLAAGLVRRDASTRRWWLAALLSVAGTLGLASGYDKWWGGWSIGPRLMTEAAPFLPLLLIPIWQNWSRLGRVRFAFLSSVLVAMATQTLFAYSPRVHLWSGEVLDPHPESLWSLSNGQMAAAWIPGWRPAADPVNKQFMIRGDLRRWHRIALGSAANARYDLDPFQVNAPENSWDHYSRLDSGSLNSSRSLFHFSPAGKPNVVTTCRAASPTEIPVPGIPCSRIHVIVAAGATDRRNDAPILSFLEVKYADSSIERIPVRLDVDAFEYALERRGGAVDPSRVYWGRPTDADVLVVSTFAVSKPGIPILAIRAVGEESISPAGITVFAITLEEGGPGQEGGAGATARVPESAV